MRRSGGGAGCSHLTLRPQVDTGWWCLHLILVGAGVSSLHKVALFLPLTWNRRYVAHICEFLKNLTNKKALRLRLVSTVLYRLAPASPLETNFGAAYLSYFYTSPFGTEYLAISTSETPFFVANRSTIIMEHPRP